MQYRSKEVDEAIQHTGSNEEEIVSFLKKILILVKTIQQRLKKKTTY